MARKRRPGFFATVGVVAVLLVMFAATSKAWPDSSDSSASDGLISPGPVQPTDPTRTIDPSPTDSPTPTGTPSPTDTPSGSPTDSVDPTAPPSDAGTDPAPAPDCTPDEQNSGDCIGWAGSDQSNMELDAVASSILLGQTAQAEHYFDANSQSFDTVSSGIARQALDSAESTADPDVTLKLLPAQTADGAVVQPDLADQANNGEPKATSLYSWLLHGSATTKIYYGYCSSGNCKTLGSETAELRADVYYPSDGPHWYQDVIHYSGARSYMHNNNVRVRRDINNEPDITNRYVDCSPAGYSLFCNEYAPTSMSKGTWHYFAADWVNQVSGYPEDAVEVGTRRWEIISSSNWQFIAANHGG